MPSDAIITLAQSATTSGTQLQVLVLVGVLIAITLLGALVVFLLRRKLLGKSADTADDASLMGSLKHLRDTGQISDAEYETTRKAMAKRAVERAMRQKQALHTPPKRAGGDAGIFITGSDGAGGTHAKNHHDHGKNKAEEAGSGDGDTGGGDGGGGGGGGGGGD